jgi:flagellar biosynthetic protein FliP
MSPRLYERSLRLCQKYKWYFLSFFFFVLNSSILNGENILGVLDLKLGEGDGATQLVPAVKILSVLTILSVAPALLLMTTSFTRILIVLSFVRQAMGTQTMPPNQVVVGLALFLTFFTMKPIWNQVEEKAWTPYVNKTISEKEFFEKLTPPVKDFMIRETRQSDLALFQEISKDTELSLTTVMPAFLISELKTAFQMGFLIYIPFLVIDMVVSSILMAMGMMMLPPTVVSLPFKLVLFVLVDGWSLLVSSVVRSFQSFS